MTNLLFENHDVYEEFTKLCDTNLLSVISDITKNYHNKKIIKVYFEGYNLNVILNLDGEIVKVSSNYQEMQTYISSDKKEYSIIYDNHPHKLLAPKAYVYQKDNKVLIKKNIINPEKENMEKDYFYTFHINNHCYQIDISDYENTFNEKELTKYALSKHLSDISDINEMYSLIVNSNDLSHAKLQIIDSNNNDILLMLEGILLKYHITYKNNNVTKEVFLKDNKFYEKEITMKELNEDKVYIKKIGGRYGTGKEN